MFGKISRRCVRCAAAGSGPTTARPFRAATHKPTSSVPSIAPGKYIQTPRCRAHTSSRGSSTLPQTNSSIRLVQASCSTRNRKLARSAEAEPLKSTIVICSVRCRACVTAEATSPHSVTSHPPSRAAKPRLSRRESSVETTRHWAESTAWTAVRGCAAAGATDKSLKGCIVVSGPSLWMRSCDTSIHPAQISSAVEPPCHGVSLRRPGCGPCGCPCTRSEISCRERPRYVGPGGLGRSYCLGTAPCHFCGGDKDRLRCLRQATT